MELLSDWELKIKNFQTCYKTLKISVTPKIHSIFYEIPIFIKRKNKPLGYFSEQKFESVHADLKPTLAWYKRAENHPDYAKKLKDGIVSYNSEHM